MCQKYLTFHFCLIIQFALLVSFCGMVVPVFAKETGLCIFVAGWRTQGTNLDSELNTLVEGLNWQYPDIQFSGKRLFWNSFSTGFLSLLTYNDAVSNTDEAADELYETIIQLPEGTRKNLILVGHSLGCRVIMKALVRLDEKHLKVKQVIFFAAAISDDSPGIESVINCSQEVVQSFIHPQDGALMAAREWEGIRALGLGGLKKRDKFRELLIAKNKYSEGGRKWYEALFSPAEQVDEFVHEYIPNHEIGHFIYAWKKSTYNWGMPLVDDIIIPQVRSNVKKGVMDKKYHWTLIDNCCGWELQQNDWDGHYRILHPYKYRVARGGSIVENVFARIKEQLLEPDSDEYLSKIPTGFVLPAFNASNEVEQNYLLSIYHKDARIWNPATGHFENIRTAHNMPTFIDESGALDLEKLAQSFENAIKKQMREEKTYDPEVVFALASLLYNFGETDEAIALWRKSAEKNFHRALYELGICYMKGEGGLDDESVGMLYLEKAAELGNLQAVMVLADIWKKCYWESQDERDLKKCRDYWKIAAEKGHPVAQYMYAKFLSPEEAFYWYKEAAFQGFSEAQFEVGCMYLTETGIETDEYHLAYAVAWFKRAAVQGHAIAAYNLGFIYWNEYEDAGLQRNPWEAEKWLKISADAGFADAKELYEEVHNYNRRLEK